VNVPEREWFLHDNKYWISRFSYKDLPHRNRAGLAEICAKCCDQHRLKSPDWICPPRTRATRWWMGLSDWRHLSDGILLNVGKPIVPSNDLNSASASKLVRPRSDIRKTCFEMQGLAAKSDDAN